MELTESEIENQKKLLVERVATIALLNARLEATNDEDETAVEETAVEETAEEETPACDYNHFDVARMGFVLQYEDSERLEGVNRLLSCPTWGLAECDDEQVPVCTFGIEGRLSPVKRRFFFV